MYLNAYTYNTFTIMDTIDRLDAMVTKFDKRHHLDDLTDDDYRVLVNELEFGLSDIKDSLHYYINMDDMLGSGVTTIELKRELKHMVNCGIDICNQLNVLNQDDLKKVARIFVDNSIIRVTVKDSELIIYTKKGDN